MLFLILSVACSVLVSVLLKLAPRRGIDIAQAVTWNSLAASVLSLLVLQPSLQTLQSGHTPWLALLGLDAQRITRPSGSLSAGERIKGALACALHPSQATGLLLLDEPGNALDLAALEALEQLLAEYRGTLVMVSHDAHLLRALQATDVLTLAAANAV